MKKIVLAGTSVYGLENHSDDSMLSVFTREIHANLNDVRIVLLARHPSKKIDELFYVNSLKNCPLYHLPIDSSLELWSTFLREFT